MTDLIQMQILALHSLQQVINHAEKKQLTNTQEFLDFLDTVNELSVTY